MTTCSRRAMFWAPRAICIMNMVSQAYGPASPVSLPVLLSRRGWLVMALLGLGFAGGAAGAGQAELRWHELAAVIVGHVVSIRLPQGELVTGQALAVRDQSLMLDIGKTSDPSRYPKGQASILRASITEVRVLQQRGSGARILGSVVGALVGVVGGAEIAVHGAHTEAAGVSTFSAVAVACTVGGYYLGRSVDRSWTQLRIAPSSAAPGLPAAGF